MNSPYMTVNEVAEYLRLHPLTIYRDLKKGIIKGVKPQGRWLIKKSDIEAYLEGSK